MSGSAAEDSECAVLRHLLAIVENIALTGDVRSVTPLLKLTVSDAAPPLVAALAEAFGRMVVKLEAREFHLECTIEQLQAVKGDLELANHDALTGLPNRVIALDRLHAAIAGVVSAEQPLQGAVFCIDLDRFKPVNDRWGHAAGDELLQQVAARLRRCVRDSDTVARFGGDEFLCVLPRLDRPALAEAIAVRILEALGQPFDLSMGSATISASIGIALFPDHGVTTEAVVHCADLAMYQCKCVGHNCYRVFDGVTGDFPSLRQ